MALPSTPPVYGPTGSNEAWRSMMKSIKAGERGWRAYAVQCIVGTAADGIWGPLTTAAVKKWQRQNGLEDDAIVGGLTQAKALDLIGKEIDRSFSVVPDGLIDGFARVEGANILCATNWYTPPGATKRGCDCGPAQIRVYEPYHLERRNDMPGLLEAFNPAAAMLHTARVFTGRITSYKSRNPTLPRRTRIEAAVLAHNAPFLADQIVRNGKLSTPSATAVWTTIPEKERKDYGGRLHFTHAEWAKEYPRRVLMGIDY